MVVDGIYNLRHIQRHAVQLGDDDLLALVGVLVVTVAAPRLAVLELQVGIDALQNALGIAVDLDVHRDVLVELRLVDVDMDDLGLGRIFGDAASDTVGEAHAHRQYHVGLLRHLVGRDVAVHAHHADVVMVVEIHGTAAQQGAGHRDASLVGALGQDVLRTGDNDSLTRNDERFLGIVQQLDGFLDAAGNLFRFVRTHHLDHLAQSILLVVDVVAHLGLGVFGKADKHRTRTVAAGNMECLRHHFSNL